jgi:hypothetical protein
MTECPNCGHMNEDDTDFCVRCRDYLRWNPTEVRAPNQQAATAQPSHQQAPTPPLPPAVAAPVPLSTPAPANPAPAVDSDAVRVTLRSAADPASAGGGTPAARVAPGARTSMSAIVRNEDVIVDTYALRIEGLPESWWSVTPQSIHLLPFGSNDHGYEQEVEVSLHPPRAPESAARAWPFALVAASGVHAGLSGSANGSLVVERYDELECTLRPQRAAGTRSARYAVTARNRGNAPVTISLSATDPDDLIRFSFAPAQLQLGAGAQATVDLHVDTEAPAADRERELRFSVAVTSDHVAAATGGAFVQSARQPSVPQQSRWNDRSWLLWLRVALTLLAATLLIAGSFAHWVDDRGTGLIGVCAHGTPSGCLDYADSVVAITGSDLAGQPADDLPGIAYFVSSLGFLTILMGVVALAGVRRGNSAWAAGIVALIVLIVLAVQADAAGGIWIPILGALIAIVAGFLPVIAGESASN